MAWFVAPLLGSVLRVKRPDDAKFDPFLVRVGECIAEVRRRVGLTQEQLAERLDVIPRVVQKIESGRTNLTLRTVARIADALGVDPGMLVVGTPRPKTTAKAPARPRTPPASGARPK